jgi:hypothetical protein
MSPILLPPFLMWFSSMLSFVSYYLGPSPSCHISAGALKGINNVVFSLNPSVSDLLSAHPNINTPLGLFELLNSPSNPAKLVATTLENAIQKAVLPQPAPKCNFFWISSELFCDAIPGSILTSLCEQIVGIREITLPATYNLLNPPLLPNLQ